MNHMYYTYIYKVCNAGNVTYNIHIHIRTIAIVCVCVYRVYVWGSSSDSSVNMDDIGMGCGTFASLTERESSILFIYIF